MQNADPSAPLSRRDERLISLKLAGLLAGTLWDVAVLPLHLIISVVMLPYHRRRAWSVIRSDASRESAEGPAR